LRFRPGGCIGRRPKRDPQASQEYNQSAKRLQANPRKSKQKGFISLFFFGPIGTFQWVTAEKTKKSSNALTRVWGCAQNVSSVADVIVSDHLSTNSTISDSRQEIAFSKCLREGESRGS
jgi:hypothetical protein